MISSFYYKFYTNALSCKDVRLILYGLGDILPSNVNAKSVTGFTGSDGRTSSIMSGKDPDGNNCFIMYVVGAHYSDIYARAFNHYSGTGHTHSEKLLFPAHGTAELRKYYSYDGLTWIEWSISPVSPQSVWNSDGSQSFYTGSGGGDGYNYTYETLPIPYSDEFGSVFGPTGPLLPNHG